MLILNGLECAIHPRSSLPSMAASGQDQPNEKHRPNDRFVIRKRTLGMVSVNDRFWPISAIAIQPSRTTERGHLRS